MSLTDPESPAEPLTMLRCLAYAGDHAEAAKALLSDAIDGAAHDIVSLRDLAAAHIGLAQVYATLLSAGVACHRPESLTLRAVTRAMYDPDEV